MSSRNQRLSEGSKIKAAEIFLAIKEKKNEVKKSPNEIEKILQKKREELLNKGFKKMVVITPAFVTDCLETLEEIEGENKEYFMHAGGESYSYIKCLNDSDSHAELIAEIVKNNT